MKNILLAVLVLLFTSTATNAGDSNIEVAHDLVEKERYQEAFDIYSDLALFGDSVAQYHAGSMLTRGRGVKRNCSEGIKLLRIASKNGNANASFAMHVLSKAKAHKCGMGDSERADTYLEKAIEQGYEL